MVISDIMKYKSKVMAKLIECPEVFQLIDNREITSSDELINKNIFSRMRVPDTSDTVKNYICFDIRARGSSYNDLYKNITVNVVIICHEGDIATPWGNRHDVLAGVIIDLFNWSNFLGLELELLSDDEDIMEKKFNIRTLQFKNLVLNSIQNGVKVNGIK